MILGIVLGIIIMYIISGIAIFCAEEFGDGVLDEKLLYAFCWWIALPIRIINFLKKILTK